MIHHLQGRGRSDTDNSPVKGRIAVVTGASGIGKACDDFADLDYAQATRVGEAMGGSGYAIDVGVAPSIRVSPKCLTTANRIGRT